MKITHIAPEGRGVDTFTVPGGCLSVRELIAVLQRCHTPDSYVVIRDSEETPLNCDMRMVNSVTIRRNCTVVLNFGGKGWD